MSTSSFIDDALTRHAVFLSRREGAIHKDLVPILEGMIADIERRLMRENTDFQNVRLRALYKDLNQIITLAGTEFSEELIKELNELAAYEAGFTQRMMSEATSATWVLPASAQVLAVVGNAEMTLNIGKKFVKYDVDSLLSTFDKSNKIKIRRIIRNANLRGATLSEIVKEIGEVSKQTRANAEAVVRTASNAINNEARKQTYLANADVLIGEQWLSTLDTRTTAICSKRDLEIYPVGTNIRPPAHYGCRSTMKPVVNPKYAIPGLKGTRSAVNGPVSNKADFGSFLRNQSAEFQKEYFSKFPDANDRYKLFKQGGLPIGRFVDARGATYTMKELQALEPMAFARAGV